MVTTRERMLIGPYPATSAHAVGEKRRIPTPGVVLDPVSSCCVEQAPRVATTPAEKGGKGHCRARSLHLQKEVERRWQRVLQGPLSSPAERGWAKGAARWVLITCRKGVAMGGFFVTCSTLL